MSLLLQAQILFSNSSMYLMTSAYRNHSLFQHVWKQKRKSANFAVFVFFDYV